MNSVPTRRQNPPATASGVTSGAPRSPPDAPGEKIARSVISLFDALALRERLFVRGRLLSAPLKALAARVPAGHVADIGCGHGVLSALIAFGRPDRQVTAIDIDPRKTDWARRALAPLPNVSVSAMDIEELARTHAGEFDSVVIADVLYLLPPERWEGFLANVSRLLKPGGTLLLKDAEKTMSWKYLKCIAQEQLMVRLLRRTRGSGGLRFMPREWVAQTLALAGFQMSVVVDLSKGYATPHVLYIAHPGETVAQTSA